MTWESAVGEYLDRVGVRRVTLAVYGFASTLLLLVASPLGWDEAVYSSRAKDLAGSNFSWGFFSGPYWSDQRAPGFPVAQALAFKWFGTTDFMARALVVAASIGLLVVIARTLDLLYPRRVGTSAIALAVVCPGYAATATLAFADIPAALFAVLAVYVILHAHVERSTRDLYLIPVVLGIATTMRFGAVMLVAVPLVVVVVLVAIRAIRERDWRTLLAHGAAGAVSLIVVLLLLTTKILTKNDSPIGAKSGRSVERPADQWLSDLRVILNPGPVDYGFNGAFWGWSFASLFTVLVVVVVARMAIARRLVSLVVFGAIALAPVVLYGVTVRQFVTTYLAPLFAIGAGMVAAAFWAPVVPSTLDDGREAAEPPPESESESESEPEPESEAAQPAPISVGQIRLRRFVLIALAATYLGVGLSSYRGVDKMHDRLGGWDQLRAASFVADDLLGPGCSLLTSRVPQAVWYSDCRVAGFSGAFVPADDGNDGNDDDGTDDDLFDRYLTSQAARVGAGQSGATVGFLLLDGLSGEPKIDQIWPERIEERSVVLFGKRDRRSALLAVEVP